MMLNDDVIKDYLTPREGDLVKSHLLANARIRELEMRLEDCRLDAEGLEVMIQEKQRAETKLQEFVEAAEAKDRIENLKEPDYFPNPEKRYAFQDTKSQILERYQITLKAAKEE